MTVRADVDDIRHLIALSGSQINVAGTALLLGVPELQQLIPVADLRSRLVVIKLSRCPKVTAEAFIESLNDQLQAIDVVADEVLIGDRRTLRIKDREVVGYEVCLNGLASEVSLRIQEHGLGGRHRMGAGLFVPYDAASWNARRLTQSKEMSHG